MTLVEVVLVETDLVSFIKVSFQASINNSLSIKRLDTFFYTRIGY